MQDRRNSHAGSGIPQMRSGIPRPGSATTSNGAESSILRSASRAATAPGHRAASGPMGAYNRPSSAASNRSSMGPTISAPSSSLLRQAPASAAPSTRTYSGLASRISTLSARPLDPNTSANLLGSDDISSASLLLDTSLGLANHKRTVSAAGIGDESISSMSFSKRPHLRKLSMDGTTPLILPSALPPHPSSTTPRPESPAYEIAVLRTHYDQQLLSESRKYKKLEQEYEAKCKELDRFNRQRVELLDEWDRVQEGVRSKETEWDTKRASLQDELVRLRSQNSDLTNKMDELQSTSSAQLSELRAKVTTLESDWAKSKAEAAAAQAKANSLQDEVGANRAELEDLQNALEDEQRMRLAEVSEARLGGGEEGKKIANELARQTCHLRKLEAEHAHLVAENGRLTERGANVELLKEEKRALEAKLRGMDAIRDELAAKEAEVVELKENESGWEQLLRTGLATHVEAAFAAAANIDAPIPNISAPQVVDRNTLPKYLSTLQGTSAGLEARCKALQASLEKLRTRNATLEDESKDVDSKQRKTLQQLVDLQTQVARAQKTESRLQDEVTRLKAMLESYEQEEKNHDNSSYSNAHAQRIQLLEGELEKAQSEYSRLVEELETVSRALAEKESKSDPTDFDDQDLQTRLDALASEKASLETKLSDQTASLGQLQRDLEMLGSENESLWLRVGRGEFDQERQRCLVLAQNPVSMDLDLRKNTLDALKVENQGLLARVKELSTLVSTTSATASVAEASSNTMGAQQALVPQSVVENLKRDIEGLNMSIAAKEKAMLRLKQVFSAKANEFREAIQSLFGYKVKFLENGKVKLTSTFNRSANSTSLVFESEGGNVGRMRLMGEAVKFPGLVDLKALKEYWLDPNGIRQSVPCFLAALNLELYEGCTMAVRRAKFDGEGQDEEDG
ncbi:related to spindle assembly checkpoint protein [Melanopsichium pennsylvanicum]|uniref:Spindle assembly checkpoint component MAD1 n=2 Tax=Melanopsichium pennsylvanicum TaxID=63383 RepID=A0AAJ5C7E3_9BASI|nr:related to spindle assembly checkpoint protein [Melanopsichium pennsylvanicum 4]SNX86473.1 related to spindle assembly checkpoint protein [Melanopsichium pennsylvanicum]